MLEYIALAICYIIGVGMLIWVLGARLGHGEERKTPRKYDPVEDIPVERL